MTKSKKSEPKRDVYVVMTAEAISVRSAELSGSLDKRLPGTVVAVRDTCQAAFLRVEELTPEYGELFVRLVKVTNRQLEEHLRQEALEDANRALRKGAPNSLKS
ncbi:MAG TPA: hypothetical protein VHC69_13190 [Polyangiaceae bacterium]|nr:hypothetical protein [Polyangiaceae bacterium]